MIAALLLMLTLYALAIGLGLASRAIIASDDNYSAAKLLPAAALGVTAWVLGTGVTGMTLVNIGMAIAVLYGLDPQEFDYMSYQALLLGATFITAGVVIGTAAVWMADRFDKRGKDDTLEAVMGWVFSGAMLAAGLAFVGGLLLIVVFAVRQTAALYGFVF